MTTLTPAEYELKIRQEILKLTQTQQQAIESSLQGLQANNATADEYQVIWENVVNLLDKISDDLDYINLSFKRTVAELSSAKSLINQQKSGLNKLADVAKNILEVRMGETVLDDKKKKSIDDQLKKGLRILKTTRDQLIGLGVLTQEQQIQLDYIKDQIKETEKIFAGRKKVLDVEKKINEQLGFLPKTAAGVDKIFSKLGIPDLGLNKAIEETHKLGQEADALGNKFNATSTYFKVLGENAKSAFTQANMFQFVLLQIINTIIKIDKQTGDLAKGFNITYNEANNLRDQLYLMAQDSGKLTSNTRAYQETILAIGKSLGSNAMLNEKDVETFTLLRDAAGFTNDELIKMQKLTFVSGGHLEDNYVNLVQSAKAVGLNNKVLLNEKDIMRDVANTSDAIKLSLGASSKELGAAAAQVKVLGMNMKQVEDIAGSLLDFESSIKAELEAELLTGKDLNLERARLYAINNDMAGVAREIRKNYGSIEEFGRLNRIQQEAAAKAVGMSREELAKTLTDEKALNKLSGDDLELGQAALDFARSRGMSEEQIRKKTIKDLEDQMSVQEKLNASIDKFKEAFVGIAQAVLPVVSAFAKLVGYIASSTPGLRIMQALMTGILARSVATAIASIFGAGARTGNILTLALTAGIATSALFGAMDAGKEKAQSASRTGNDVISPPPGYGKRTLFGPEGEIHFNDKDTIFAGTDDSLLKPNKIKKPSSIPPTIDYNKMAIAFAKEVNNRPIIFQSSVQVEGKELARIVGNESTTLGTNLNKTVRQIS